MAKTIGLDGQGISALFGDQKEDERYFECAIAQITPNRYQPRMMFDQQELAELADSIKENGVIQPLVVSRLAKKKFGLVAGERRLRAAKMAGLKTVPVVVKDVSDNTLLEYALIENIQRTDLNPIEEAEAFKKLVDDFGLTQEAVAGTVGKSRSAVANALRLLQLPDYIREDILSGALSEGHARPLLGLVTEPATLKEVRDQVVAKQMSVRQTEQLVKAKRSAAPYRRTGRKREGEFSKSVCRSLENRLTNRLSSQVSINQNGSRGRIEIAYYSYDDLERITTMITGEEMS